MPEDVENLKRGYVRGSRGYGCLLRIMYLEFRLQIATGLDT